MRHRNIAAASAAATLAALAAGPAQAHVTLQPGEAPAGGFTRLDVRVPNERDRAGTTKVQVQFPPGFESVSTEPRAGWRAKVTRRGNEVETLTLTAERGVRIAPGEFVDFGLSLRMPEQAGTSLTFKALQTYDNGEVVRWIGPPDSEEPAPQVALVAAAQQGPAPAPADDGDDDEGASTGLVAAALVLGALGLLSGLAGVATARRARARAA
ncbi:MAG TPA: YcnI family protein [Solirubrobacteraceae bacterium]|nr:YcnI family protein [Solirubrobacteraceae bacterium]